LKYRQQYLYFYQNVKVRNLNILAYGTMKIVRNTLFVVGGKGEKGRLRTILLVTAIAATQEGGSPSQHHATFAW